MTEDVTLDGDQLIATRWLDAPPEVVWQLFTTPEHLAAFWGGEHAAVAPDSVVVDLQVGGWFELETVGTDGRTHRLRFRYDVIQPPALLVLLEPVTGLVTQIHLQPTSGGTTVLVHQRRLPPQLQTEQARAGLAGILRRLDVVLHGLSDRTERPTR